jgi:hypothetical protein
VPRKLLLAKGDVVGNNKGIKNSVGKHLGNGAL